MIEKKLEKLNSSPRNFSNISQTNGYHRRELTCYGCGEPGHVERRCMSSNPETTNTLVWVYLLLLFLLNNGHPYGSGSIG